MKEDNFMKWGQIDVNSNKGLDSTINKHTNGVLFPQIAYINDELLQDFKTQAGVSHYNEFLKKRVVLIPKKLMNQIMDKRLYWGNITLQTNPELKVLFEELSVCLGISVDNMIINCIDDRNKYGEGIETIVDRKDDKPKESISFAPRILGGALLGYAQSTQLVAKFLNKFGISYEETFEVALGQYEELGGLSGHVGDGGHNAISCNDYSKCGCGAIKSLLLYLDEEHINMDDNKEGSLSYLSSFLKKLMHYNNTEKEKNPLLFPEYSGSHRTDGGMVVFKNIIFDKDADADGYMPYTLKNDGVFSYNKILQRKFITTEVISLINKVLERELLENRNNIVYEISKVPSLELNIDKSNSHIILNEHNRMLMWGILKEDFNIVNNIILSKAAQNVPAIKETYTNSLIM